ncbi:Hypothetical protein MVR_LOCUS56 [uncultured virus]|nr:Hypothetical protein MVR_LOCUS56 [uncultured virus]
MSYIIDRTKDLPNSKAHLAIQPKALVTLGITNIIIANHNTTDTHDATDACQLGINESTCVKLVITSMHLNQLGMMATLSVIQHTPPQEHWHD